MRKHRTLIASPLKWQTKRCPLWFILNSWTAHQSSCPKEAHPNCPTTQICHRVRWLPESTTHQSEYAFWVSRCLLPRRPVPPALGTRTSLRKAKVSGRKTFLRVIDTIDSVQVVRAPQI
jgi:hypothetical protein